MLLGTFLPFNGKDNDQWFAKATSIYILLSFKNPHFVSRKIVQVRPSMSISIYRYEIRTRDIDIKSIR